MVHDYYISYHMIGKEATMLIVRSAHVVRHLAAIQREGGLIVQVQAVCDDPVQGYCACAAAYYPPVTTVST